MQTKIVQAKIDQFALEPKVDLSVLAKTVMRRCDVLATCTEESSEDISADSQLKAHQDPCPMTRRYLTEAMGKAHAQLKTWMQALGLDVRVDAAGNLIGRYGDPSPQTPVLILGSHIDTVPNGGKYDGVLGVLIALAAVELLQGKANLNFAIDVIAFSEEEGVRYTTPYLGSAAVAGTFDNKWLKRCDTNGVSMWQAISDFDLDPNQIPDAAYDPAYVLGYLETHLEQGPVLEFENCPVGIVSAIAGQSRLMLRFVGEPGHAGTTPMSGRRDALVCAAALIHQVNVYAQSIKGLRATVGHMQVHPNVRNVIPGVVELSVDIRHAQDEVREKAVCDLLSMAERLANNEDVQLLLVEQQSQPAVVMDRNLTTALSDSMREAGLHPFELLSGAGRDAVAMAESFPVGMLFVRHPEGVSHHPDERVDVDDVAVAIEVLSRAIMHLSVGKQVS